MDKKEQEKLLTEIMHDDEKDGLYDHIGDTNKMVTMKLYTEEQVKDMFSGVVNPHHIDVFLEENYTPIELPTNEDIEKEFTIGETTYIDCIKGAKWVIEHIKKQK